MKKLGALIAAIWLGIILIPCAVAAFLGSETYAVPDSLFPNTKGPSATTAPPFEAQSEIDAKKGIKVLNTKTGEVMAMNQLDYLIGVVAAEMPASFNIEALKAQAVAARSYSAYKIENFASLDASHGGHDPKADVCTDYTHCKAYMDENAMHELWGNDFDKYFEKIRTAVLETDGQILVYGGETVNAVFHSTSSGMTEKAADVWGLDVPYLQSVASPGESLSPSYLSSAEFTKDEFKKIITDNYPDAKVPEEKLWAFPLAKSASGGVMSADIFGVSIDGIKLRSMFALKSTHFDITFDGEKVKFSVKGYGHGVGMSQYGANYLANEGYTYGEILAWYYTDTSLETRGL